MITCKECNDLLGEYVGIGVKNFHTDGIFFYYGDLLEVNSDYLKIKMTIGYKQIELSEIVEIKIARREGYRN